MKSLPKACALNCSIYLDHILVFWLRCISHLFSIGLAFACTQSKRSAAAALWLRRFFPPSPVDDPGDFPEIVVGCPPDITSTLAVNRDLAEVFWFPPQAVDRNGMQVPAVGSHQPGDSFPTGFTTVTYTFTDFEGNVEFCSFMVLVLGECEVCPCFFQAVSSICHSHLQLPPKKLWPSDAIFVAVLF